MPGQPAAASEKTVAIARRASTRRGPAARSVREEVVAATAGVMHDPQVIKRFDENTLDVAEAISARVRKDADVVADLAPGRDRELMRRASRPIPALCRSTDGPPALRVP